jgi:Flp pilus assembly protein TadG
MRRSGLRRTGTPPASAVGRGELLTRLWSARGGVTAVEMAFLMPVFLLFLMGIVEFGRALWTQTALQFAVEAAARCEAVSPSLCTAPGTTSPTNVPAYAAGQAFGMSIPTTDFAYTAKTDCTGASTISTSGGRVTASYRFKPIVAKLVPLNVTLTACSYHP